MHAEVAASLRSVGFQVRFEYPIRYLGGKRGGRIDLLITHGEARAALELDTRKPRKKSIAKLQSFDGYRIVGLRGVHWQEEIEGIDAVVCLKVRQAKATEIADRRTVKRSPHRRIAA